MPQPRGDRSPTKAIRDGAVNVLNVNAEPEPELKPDTLLYIPDELYRQSKLLTDLDNLVETLTERLAVVMVSVAAPYDVDVPIEHSPRSKVAACITESNIRITALTERVHLIINSLDV
jgi:hypothetical protein